MPICAAGGFDGTDVCSGGESAGINEQEAVGVRKIAHLAQARCELYFSENPERFGFMDGLDRGADSRNRS
jgi:hypothetical protein